MRPMPVSRPATRLPTITTTVVLDLSEEHGARRERAEAAGLDAMWPGSRVVIRVGDRRHWSFDSSVPHLLTDAAVRRGLRIDFEGDGTAVAEWAALVRDLICGLMVAQR